MVNGKCNLVSILVAAYNAEQYIHQCLDSLLAQTHKDWEALCVDDCSTDNTLSILNEYAKKDARIKVIHLNENQGQAKARNIAIQQGTGELFCFLDSDDWFAPDSLEKAVNIFEANQQADCVLFRLIKTYPEGKEEEYTMDSAFPLTGEEAFRKSLDWSVHGVYMVRADIQREIPYDDTCRSYSDDNSTRLHYLRSREVHLSEGIYYYRQNPTSVSHIEDTSRFNFLLANEHMQQMLQDMHMSDDILNLHELVRHNNLMGAYLFFCEHRKSWSDADRQYSLSLMHRIWSTIQPQRLKGNPRHHRFGYLHCPSWPLYRLQEEVFYWLRKVMGKKGISN